MDSGRLLKKFQALESERNTIEGVWKLIEQFVLPFRGNFYNDGKSEHEMEWRHRELYDSTAIQAAQTLSASIHGALTSPSFRWFDLRFRNEDLNTNHDAKTWIEECSQLIYYAIQDSNFNLEVNETYTDMVGFGSSVVFEEMDGDEYSEESKLAFSAIPVKECYFDEDHNGFLVNFYRKIEMTPIQMMEKFGEENLPQHIQEMCDDSKGSTEKFTIVFCVYKRKGDEYENVDVTGVVVPAARPYGFKYIMQKDGTELSSGGYYEMPAFIPRWRRTTDSKWGNSPAMVALPDILTVNQLTEMILRSLEKVVDPANMATERGLLSDLDLGAGGLTIVRDLDSLKPYESRARFDVAGMSQGDLRHAIRQAFYVDQLELKDSPAMTATEVQVRYELMQRLLGPTLGRLESDFLSPMITRTFFLLMRADKLPDMPESVAGADFDVQYTGPLSRAQKVDKASSTERWLQNLAGMAEFAPEILDNFDSDEAARDLADTLSVPAKYLRSQNQVRTIRRQRQEQQQRQMEVEQAKAEGEAMKATGEGAQALRGADNG